MCCRPPLSEDRDGFHRWEKSGACYLDAQAVPKFHWYSSCHQYYFGVIPCTSLGWVFVNLFRKTSLLVCMYITANSLYLLLGDSNHVEYPTRFSLLLHLLERSDVDLLVDGQSQKSRLHPDQFRVVCALHQANSVFWQVEETQLDAEPLMSHLPHFTTNQSKALQVKVLLFACQQF